MNNFWQWRTFPRPTEWHQRIKRNSIAWLPGLIRNPSEGIFHAQFTENVKLHFGLTEARMNNFWHWRTFPRPTKLHQGIKENRIGLEIHLRVFSFTIYGKYKVTFCKPTGLTEASMNNFCHLRTFPCPTNWHQKTKWNTNGLETYLKVFWCTIWKSNVVFWLNSGKNESLWQRMTVSFIKICRYVHMYVWIAFEFFQ